MVAVSGSGFAQRYSDPRALERLAAGLCPECALGLEAHSEDPRFWVPRVCDLRADGVSERLRQFQADQAQAQAPVRASSAQASACSSPVESL